MPFPDLSSFYPGYERKNSEAERRQTQVWVVIRATLTRVTTRLRFGRGSLVGVPPRLWLRRPNATTQLQFRASLAGAFKRALPANRPAAVQRCFSQTGRNAGRADNPKLPGSGLQVRPRAPHSPRAAACRLQRVQPWARFSLYVTEPVTIVNRTVTAYFPLPLWERVNPACHCRT